MPLGVLAPPAWPHPKLTSVQSRAPCFSLRINHPGAERWPWLEVWLDVEQQQLQATGTQSHQAFITAMKETSWRSWPSISWL